MKWIRERSNFGLLNQNNSSCGLIFELDKHPLPVTFSSASVAITCCSFVHTTRTSYNRHIICQKRINSVKKQYLKSYFLILIKDMLYFICNKISHLMVPFQILIFRYKFSISIFFIRDITIKLKHFFRLKFISEFLLVDSKQYGFKRVCSRSYY